MTMDPAKLSIILSDESRMNDIRKVISSVVSTKRNYSTVLDIGCGPGYTTTLLDSELNVEHIYGIDIDEKVIEYAKQNQMKDNIRYIAQDFSAEFEAMAPELKSLEGSVELILAISCLQTIHDKERVAKNLWRMLAKGGRVGMRLVLYSGVNSDLTAEEKTRLEKVFMTIPEPKTQFSRWLNAFKSVGFNVVTEEMVKYKKSMTKDYFMEFILPLFLSDLRMCFVSGLNEKTINEYMNELTTKIISSVREHTDATTGETMVEGEMNFGNIILQK